MAEVDFTGGYEPQLDYPLGRRPEMGEMRESVSMWIYDDRGRFGLPRFCIEALAAHWHDRGVQANVALADGRVFRCAGGFAGGAGADGRDRARSLEAGPLRFEIVEPLRRWRMCFDGEVAETRAQAQIDDRPPIATRRLRLEVDAMMAAPPWSSGEENRDRATALTIGAVGGHRHEQLFRCCGRLEIEGERTSEFTGTGLRVRRYGVRDNGVFPGHVWQSALFPSGRGFGLIAIAPAAGRSEGFSECYVFDGRRKVRGRVAKAPWLTDTDPTAGSAVDVLLDTSDGEVSIEGWLAFATAFPPDASLFGQWTENGEPRRLGQLNVQQAGALYRWAGEQTYGMIDRSWPAGD